MKLLALTLCLGLCAAPALADDVAEIDTASMDEALKTLDGEHAEGDHADGAHGDGHGEGHHEEGLPMPLISTATASLIVFLIFAGLLAKFAWGPLMDGLSQREQNIRGAIVEAQKARDDAKAMLAEHTKRMEGVDAEVKEIIAEARRDADHTATEIKEKAAAEAEATKSRAIAEIERAKDAAIVELATRERDLIADATETVLGRAITEDDRKRLIDDALSQFGQSA